MIIGSITKKMLCLIMATAMCLCGLSGCKTPHDYKSEADKQAYNIIDEKWKAPYGVKANYKISDTAPSPNDILIEKAVPANGILTLPQAVALATAHNREYHLEKELLYTTALDLRLTRHEFETKYFAGASGNYYRSRGGTDEAIQGGANLGFNRLLAQGAIVSTNVTAAWIDILTGDVRSGLTSILSTTVVQPLLRGSDRQIVQENLTQAERDMLYQVRLFNRFRKTFVVSIITEYCRVLELADRVENAKENCHTLDWLCDRVEKLAGVGRVPKQELERIRQDALRALDIYIQAEKEYKQVLDDFKIMLGLPTTAEFRLDEKELKALSSAEMTYPDFSESQAIETALLQRLDLVNSADAIIDAQRKIVVAADSLRGDLTLVGGSNLTPETDTDFTTLRRQKGAVDVGILLDLPVERMFEQNEYRKALITFSQRQREYEQTSDIVTLEVRQAYRDLTEGMRRYSLQSAALELAKKRLKDTYLLLRYGRASSRRVLRAQEDLFNAQNEAVDALTDYAIATLNFYYSTGVLQVRPDGMWEY